MSEHGWPDDHHDVHDDGGGHLEQHDELMPEPELLSGPDDDFFDHQHDDTPQFEPAQEVAEQHLPVDVPEPELQPEHAEVLDTLGADPDALPDDGPDAADLFPAAVDVGPLPEPVDGFPWIDTGSLGVVDQAMIAAADRPDAAELAEYAAADLPAGADPWAALAGSEDPAVSALAKFWGSAPGPDQT